jgi:hypothetical protein
MMTPANDPNAQRRLYGMMQRLLTHFAQGSETGSAPPRGVVTERDAVNAIVALAAAIDEPAQAGVLVRNRAAYMGALLMVIRDYVRPLPVGESADGSDGATADLKTMVEAIRANRRHQPGA